MKDCTIGFAMCGSYCTFDAAIDALDEVRELCSGVIPIMSENAYSTDSRFGPAAGFVQRVEELCGRAVIKDINGAETVGPGKLLDILVIAPCTGNTLSKIAQSVTDTSVTMAAKAHLRNNRPLLIAIATNDALGANAANIGSLLSRKNVYFVPFYQDDPLSKPTSLTANLALLPEAIDAALRGLQLQPLLAVGG